MTTRRKVGSQRQRCLCRLVWQGTRHGSVYRALRCRDAERWTRLIPAAVLTRASHCNGRRSVRQFKLWVPLQPPKTSTLRFKILRLRKCVRKSGGQTIFRAGGTRLGASHPRGCAVIHPKEGDPSTRKRARAPLTANFAMPPDGLRIILVENTYSLRLDWKMQTITWPPGERLGEEW